MQRSTYVAVLLALLVPPLVGATLMGLVGFYPWPEVYLIFTSYTAPYVGVVALVTLFLTRYAVRYILALPQLERTQALAMAQQSLTRLPWWMLGVVTLYSIIGALSADFSLEAMGYRHFGLREHLSSQFGLIPVVLITAFPIFFYYVDRLGRYLGPRGIHVTAFPLWAKLMMLGIVTPVLIDSLLIGYYVNQTGYFNWQTVVMWGSLAALAAGGTWLAWRSMRQGIAPLRAFIDSSDAVTADRIRSNLTPFSLDELGVLTSRYAELMTTQSTLTSSLQRAQSLSNAVLDYAGALVLVLDQEGRITLFNKACERLSGYSFAEIEGTFPWDMLLPPEDAQFVRERAFDALANNPQLLSGEFSNHWVSKRGARFLIDWTNSVILNADGHMAYMVCVGVDITERKKAEETVRESEERLRRVIDATSDGIWDWNINTHEDYLSPRWKEILGYRDDELPNVDSTFFNLIHPDDQDAVAQAVKNHFEQRTPFSIEVRMRHKDGEYRWILSRGEVVRDANGHPQRMVGSITDITERKRIEAQFRVNEGRLNEAQRLAGVGSWELDLLTGKLFWTDEIFNLFEIDKARFGATYEAFLNGIHAEDRERVNAAYTQSLSDRTPYTITHRLQMADGRIKWVEERCNTDFDTAGKPLISRGTVQDITVHWQMEQDLRHFKQTLDQTLDCVFLFDGETLQFTYVNQGAMNQIGYSEAELLQMYPYDIKPHISEAEFKQMIAPLLSGEQQQLNFETEHQHKNGTRIPVAISLQYVAPLGQASRFVAVVHDITERKRNETALIEAKQAAEAANRAKSEFLANMSHEIRTPMNAIIGLTQLVLDTGLPPRQQDFLKKAHLSAHALLNILNDILDYSKIEAGYLRMEPVPFRLEETLQHVADLFGARIEEKGLELFFEITADTPSEIVADPLRLSQVLTNLVSNAIKFTEQGEIHIRAEVMEQTPAGRQIRFAVRDTGIGLSKEQAERLFQPFSQADNSTTRKYGGTGLGLSICKRLVGLMGGEIIVSGEPGKGSTFVFTMAFEAADNAAKMAKLRVINGLRVLVVDDQETSCHILQQILEGWGVEVQVATSGEEALALAATARQQGLRFDALLLDWRMPGMSGLDVARELAQHGSQDLPPQLIMVTAHDRAQMLAEAGSLQVNSVLTKPITSSHLFDILVKSLQAKAAPAPVVRRPSKAVNETGQSDSVQGMKILLAEDNEINRIMATELFERRGVILTVACDGSEAVARFKEQRFDVVLMDLHMPVMDGLEATRQIRALPQDQQVPIIAMTAAVLQEDRDRCTAAGMVDFIAKPIEPTVLVKTLRKWVKVVDAAPQSHKIMSDTPRKAVTQNSVLPDSLPGFDLGAALHRMEGNRSLLANLLLRFAEGNKDSLARLDVLVQEGEKEKAALLLHTLKGVAGMMGAVALFDAVRQREDALRSGNATGYHQAVADTLNAALEAINNVVAPLQPPPAQTTAVFDKAVLADALHRLVPHLQERELVPAELMDVLRDLANSANAEKPFMQLMRQLDEFDHDGAFVSVMRVASAYGIVMK